MYSVLRKNHLGISKSRQQRNELLKNELTRLKRSRRPEGARSREIYDELLMDNKGHIDKTNEDIFRTFGSSQESGFMLGHQDRDCGSGVDNFIKRHFSFILALLDNHYLVFWVGYFVMIFKTTIYVIDIVKDIKFIAFLNSLRGGKDIDQGLEGLFDVGVAAAIGLLLLSEVVKVVQLYNCTGITPGQKVMTILLSPLQLIPFFIHHYERKLELRLRMLCVISEPTNDQEVSLTQTRNELMSLRRLKGEHRSTENVLEHLVQFIISLSVLVSYNSRDEILDLSPSDFIFSIVSSSISLLSMVRGQINLISSQKNSQIGLMASFLLALYFIFAILTRSGILFSSIYAIYILQNARERKPENARELPFLHLIFILITVTIMIIHILLSYLIQRKLLKGTKSNLKQALWSFLSPPLFLDWDSLYRRLDYKMPISECWRRSRNSFLLHNLLTLVGNLALGIPLYIWGYYALFTSVSPGDEAFTLVILLCTILFQAMPLGIGFIYLKKKHPWARILNANLTNFKPRKNVDQHLQRPRRHSLHVQFSSHRFLFTDITEQHLHAIMSDIASSLSSVSVPPKEFHNGKSRRRSI